MGKPFLRLLFLICVLTVVITMADRHRSQAAENVCAESGPPHRCKDISTLVTCVNGQELYEIDCGISGMCLDCPGKDSICYQLPFYVDRDPCDY